MNLHSLYIAAITAGAGAAFAPLALNGADTVAEARGFSSDVILSTDAYRWQGDTIFQNEFKAWAVSPEEIRSTYKGRPGYFMPVEQTWKRKNDLSSYPRLTSNNRLHEAIYNMGLDEMVNAVEPDTTLRTGKEWAGVWTRDVSYSIILSMCYMQPEASMISLMKKVNPSGQIIQDTGSGGAWPISTDRMIWVVAAYEIYKATGDRQWLEKVYPIALRSIRKDMATVMSPRGLIKGETSFIDWREQSYPKWMQTVDISQSEAMGTNVLYAAALNACAQMADILGQRKEAARLKADADALTDAINKYFWLDDKGYYGMYTYGRDHKIMNPRAETLGLALSILYDIAPAERQKSISTHNPHTPFGPAIFYPQISDMPSYHNNALWPFVASYWTLAQAKAGNEAGTMEGIGPVFRPAALFATNKENFNLDNGDYYTELNSSNMLWSLAGNIAITTRVLFGIHFEKDGLLISPFVPKALEGTRTLDNFNYRGATLNITVNGYGANVAKITVNGKEYAPGKTIPAKRLKGVCNIVVDMDCKPIPAMDVNRQPNLKAPVTPQTWLTNNPALNGEGVPVNNYLEWNPIEYISKYQVLKNGMLVAETRETSWPATEPGEWQVIGIDARGVPSFASEPRSNRPATIYQFKNEGTGMKSPELCNAPADGVKGYTGQGFVEIDRTTDPETINIKIPQSGMYTFAMRYANGNGPVNTENKAAIRTLMLNGSKRGTFVMPQRGVGNWDDWGMSNQIQVPLTAGTYTVGITYRPENENMNINTNHALLDQLVVEKAK